MHRELQLVRWRICLKLIELVRSMPNTPAMVGEGMTEYANNKEIFSEDEIDNITKIFKSIGK